MALTELDPLPENWRMEWVLVSGKSCGTWAGTMLGIMLGEMLRPLKCSVLSLR